MKTTCRAPNVPDAAARASTFRSALRILVVDDDAHLLEALVNLLVRLGHFARGTTGSLRALQLLDQEPAEVLLSDIRMPEMDGFSLLRAVQTRHPETAVVVMTSFASSDDAARAARDGACACLAKPFKIHEVVAALSRAAAARPELCSLRPAKVVP